MTEVTIRAARREDAAAMSALIESYAAQNLMLPRSEAQILRGLGDFLVAVAQVEGESIRERVVGCGAVAALSTELAEVRSLAIAGDQQGNGLGGRLVNRLLDEAVARGFQQVCALTLRPHFFERLGFEVVDRWSVSPKVWQECIYCPKFHHCDEIAVFMALPQPETPPVETPARRNGLIKRLMLAPIRLVTL